MIWNLAKDRAQEGAMRQSGRGLVGQSMGSRADPLLFALGTSVDSAGSLGGRRI